MPADKIILIIYGVLLIGGGFLGAKAGSKVSLIMGVLSGALILGSVYWMGHNLKAGYGLILAVSGILSFTFLLRLVQTHKFMPSGMLLILSAIVLILSIRYFISK